MDDRKNQNREPENGSGGGPKNRQTILIILICLLVSLMVMGLLNNALGGITSEDLDRNAERPEIGGNHLSGNDDGR